MNLHEFQAKEILSRYGVPILEGRVAATPEDARAVAVWLGGNAFAIKAQVHAGGRGEAGGVRLVTSPEAAEAAARAMIGQALVTANTGPRGRLVRRVYVERAVAPQRVLYVAVLVDRSASRVALIGAAEGGGDIETRVAGDPRIIETLLLGAQAATDPQDFIDFAGCLGLADGQAEAAACLFKAMVQAFHECDASLIEINPLAVMTDGAVLALDVKMIIDDNALFRHPDLELLRDEDELAPVELKAQRHEINFVKMDGDIGVVVNGAGLALATLDLLRDAGGRPANFMDIRTMATSLQIAHGLGLLLEDPAVKVLLVNIHGGGLTRCDTVAEAIGIAMRRSGHTLPLVFRAAGTNAAFSRTVLGNCGVPFIDARDMAEAVERVVTLSHERAA